MNRDLFYVLSSPAFQAYLLIGEVITDAKSCPREGHERPGYHTCLERTCLRETAVGLYSRNAHVMRLYRKAALRGLPSLVAECDLTRGRTTAVSPKHS